MERYVIVRPTSRLDDRYLLPINRLGVGLESKLGSLGRNTASDLGTGPLDPVGASENGGF